MCCGRMRLNELKLQQAFATYMQLGCYVFNIAAMLQISCKGLVKTCQTFFEFNPSFPMTNTDGLLYSKLFTNQTHFN